MKRKIISVLLMLVISLTTLWIPNSGEIAVADTCEEATIDYDWVFDIVENLSRIIKDPNLKTNGIYMGRDFASVGEREAARRIKGWMENNTRNLNCTINMYPVGNDAYDGEISNKIIQAGSNNKIDILSYSLEFKNTTHTATIPNNESFPVPKFILTSGKDIITGWNKVKLMDEDDIKDEISQDTELSYALMNENTPVPGGFGGEIVIIDDYSSASENETAGKIHLLEFMTNESEDVYLKKIQNVVDSDGLCFIFVSTNPSFIKNLSTSIFGVAISSQDALKIKNHLNKNQGVVAYFSHEPSLQQSGSFAIGAYPECIGEKYIGLIEEHSKGFPLSNMSDLCFKAAKYSKYVGYLLFNKTNPGTHYLLTPSLTPYENWYSGPYIYLYAGPAMYSIFICKAFMTVNGTISLNNGVPINIWDWANDTSLQANFSIQEQRNSEAESYNVICEVEGKNKSKSILISGGHHDYFPGQGASDNSVGVATMLGVLKYLNESKITPEYNLIFASWAGEERVLRGSSSYVFNESNYEKNENISYMINLDWFAFNSPGSKLEITTTNASLTSAVYDIFNRTNYEQNTGYGYIINISEVGDDAKPFYDCYVDSNGSYFKKDTGLKIITVGKTNMFDIVRHRSGQNHELGDVLTNIDQDDLNYTADIVLNITKYLYLETPENQFINSSYKPYDRCGDSWNDSVNISFNVTTDISSWATIRACLYNVTTGEAVSDENSTSFTIYKDKNISGHLTVTLYPIMVNGTYNASIRIYDDRMNLDDECHQLVNLSPYGKPMARFSYSYGGLFGRNVEFEDESMASPGADINQWYWDFGDYTHSHDQNTSHLYLLSDDYTVILTVWDTNGFNDSWSDTLSVPNCSPYTSFTVDANAVCVGTELSFTSTSSDEDGTIENSTWCFGDESYSYEENTTHSYSQSGVYTVTLTTTDDDGATNTTTKTDCLVIADALVDDDFHDDPDAHEWDTITEGLNDVENGNIVYVFNGHYETIEITKSVALYGENREDVLIKGENPGVKIRYHNVSLNGFNVSDGTTGLDIYVKSDKNHTSNVTIENCNIYGNSNIGILLNQSSNCTVENCTIKGSNVGVKIINGSIYNVVRKCMISHGTYGVYVSNSSNNYIGSPSISSPYPTDCTFTFNHDSIYLKDAEYNFILGCDIDGTPYPGGVSAPTKGISLDDSENNTISTCYIHDMTGTGVYLNDSTWNKIEHCKITENPNGVYYYNSPENLIVQNHFGINSEFGVYLPSNSQNNHIYYNDFFVNGNGSENQSWDANGERGKENLWSKSGNNTLTKTGAGGGNYWSDYNGNDNNQDGIGDTPYQINSSGVERNDSYPVMEPYGWCDFTQDSTMPVISNISSTPSTVGFGYNVTIRATVTDNSSNISIVKVNIIYPDQSTGNYTMDCIGGSLYQYTFTNTWTVGQYNYTIWAMDETYNSNSSGGHHFHVSAAATISVATLKDSYAANQFINITDPPNPPENYTLVGRGLTWDEYYNAETGQNILEVSAEPINYQENNGTWIPINNSISQLASNHPAYVYGYRKGNDQGLYGAFFKSNAQNNWPVAFTYNRSTDPTIHVVRSKLVGVGYLDPGNNWSYQYLQNVQNSQGQVNGNSILYANVFTGTDVIYSYENTKLKENIILSNTTKTVLQNHPPSLYGCSNNSFLVFITKLDYQNLQPYNASTPITGNLTVSEGQMDFRDAAGMLRCSLPIGEAYELMNDSSRHQLVYRIIQYNGNYFLLSGLRVTDLMEMTFPVVIDPTQEQTTWVSITNDGYIYKSSSTSYNTAWSADTGTISSSVDYITVGQNKGSTFPNPTYYVYRGFLYFNTSSLPSSAYIDDATLSLYKKGDNSTTDFTITVQNGQPTYPHNPLQFGDYNKSHYSGSGGGLSTTNFVNGKNNITLTNHSWIQKGGMTKFCLRSSRDINGTIPTGKEYVDIYSREKGTSYAPKLIIHYRNQSKIKNTGSTDINGYLLIQVQFYNSSQGKWLIDKDTINETSPRTINSSSQLALDTIFNGHVRASNLTHGAGTYRVYAAFRDPESNILKTNSGVELKAWWQFSKT